MNDCPICHLPMGENPSVMSVGNSQVHKDCYDRVDAEAKKIGATIHFIWRGKYCTEARLVFEDKRQRV